MLSWKCIKLLPVVIMACTCCAKAQETLRDSMVLGFDYTYDFRFSDAKRMVDDLLLRNPEHPWCNLLAANYYWWQVISGHDSPEMRARLNESADRIITRLAPNAAELNNEDLYVLVAAYAFRSRVELLEEHYIKSLARINKAISVVKSSLGKETESDWFFLTNGVYYYYIDYAWKHYPVLIPYLAFLPRGDCALGLSYMMFSAKNKDRILSNEGHYFLLKVYYVDGGELTDLEKGLGEAMILQRHHPNNLLYLFYMFRIQYDAGDLDEAMRTIGMIKDKSLANTQLDKGQKLYFVQKAADYIANH